MQKSPICQQKAQIIKQSKSFKDANTVSLNSRKFEKMTAFTSEGKKLSFDMHKPSKAMILAGRNGSKSPAKEEQTKSM